MKEKRKKIFCVKLPAHSAGLPGNDLLFKSVPLDPAHWAGLAGHAPVTLIPQKLRLHTP